MRLVYLRKFMYNKNRFSIDYVLKATMANMRKSVEFSISKTLDRLPQFINKPEMSVEIFTTLQVLHMLKKQIDAFEIEHITKGSINASPNDKKGE
jgi:hypothetical protein